MLTDLTQNLLESSFSRLAGRVVGVQALLLSRSQTRGVEGGGSKTKDFLSSEAMDKRHYR